MNIERLHREAQLDLEQLRVAAEIEIQEINWEHVRQMNEQIEPGWSEVTAYVSEYGNACYTRRTMRG